MNFAPARSAQTPNSIPSVAVTIRPYRCSNPNASPHVGDCGSEAARAKADVAKARNVVVWLMAASIAHPFADCKHTAVGDVSPECCHCCQYPVPVANDQLGTGNSVY